MAGHEVPYSLRPNKFVERQLFVEALNVAIPHEMRKSYAYASMGGRTLEDHKLVHDRLGFAQSISFEIDETTFRRQEFNQPLERIHCCLADSGSFIRDLDSILEELPLPAERLVIWLDYASAKGRQVQLREVSMLTRKLSAGDFLKVTLNCNPRTFGEPEKFGSLAECLEGRLEKARRTLQNYFPEDAESSDFASEPGVAQVLAKALKLAVLDAFNRSRPEVAETLCLFAYKDGEHQMLTATVGIREKNTPATWSSESWSFLSSDWTDVRTISVPQLTPRERWSLNRALFSGTPEEILEKAGFPLAGNPADALEALAQYQAHYSRYPSFLHVQI